MKKTFTLLIISFLFLSSFASINLKKEDTVLNLDFENVVVGSNYLDKWQSLGWNYRITQDKEFAQHGNYSAKIEENRSEPSDYGTFIGEMPIEKVRGKKIELRGWIKSKDVEDGHAGFWCLVDPTQQTLSILRADSTVKDKITGTTDWTQISIIMNVDSTAKHVNFGGILTGKGTVWFDNLELFIDGAKYEDEIVPTPKSELTMSEEKELRKYIYPLRTFEPDGGDTKDLEILKELIGNSTVVALGEVSHGSKEIFDMKNRIIQYLTINDDFNTFSIECTMPEASKVNEYTVEEKGDPKNLIKGMNFWTWSTEEVLNMVEWMKTYNQGKPKIMFTGFDMQLPAGAITELEDAFVENDKTKENIATVKELSNNLLKEMFATKGAPNIKPEDRDTLNSNLNIIKKEIEESSFFDKRRKSWLLQNTRILEQFWESTESSWRDTCMAENLMWIKEQIPQSKVIIWAHNTHIMNGGDRMGQHLSEILKDDYKTFAFTFYDGRYTAYASEGLGAYDAETASAGTIEYLLNKLNVPIFILDLKKIKEEGSEEIKTMIKESKFRQTGSMRTGSEFAEFPLLDRFDYLIFINRSTASTLLK